MPRTSKKDDQPRLTAEWTLPGAATLGSSVRAKGILLELRAKLPPPIKKMLDIRASTLILSVPESAEAEFRKASAIVLKGLDGIENLPVIPREIQDILTITPTERHRWLKDGRLPSAGTRTVKLHGRARKITFHVFDPRRVEEILDGDLVSAWREDDIETKAENRRRARESAAFARMQKKLPAAPPSDTGRDEKTGQTLAGWAEFEASGLLR